MFLESKIERNFAKACLGKKLALHTEICEFLDYQILNIGLFYRVKELFKSN